MALTEETFIRISEELFGQSMSNEEAAKLAVQFENIRNSLERGEKLLEMEIEPASFFSYLREGEGR